MSSFPRSCTWPGICKRIFRLANLQRNTLSRFCFECLWLVNNVALNGSRCLKLPHRLEKESWMETSHEDTSDAHHARAVLLVCFSTRYQVPCITHVPSSTKNSVSLRISVLPQPPAISGRLQEPVSTFSQGLHRQDDIPVDATYPDGCECGSDCEAEYLKIACLLRNVLMLLVLTLHSPRRPRFLRPLEPNIEIDHEQRTDAHGRHLKRYACNDQPVSSVEQLQIGVMVSRTGGYAASKGL